MPAEEIAQPIPSTAASHDTLAKVIEKCHFLPDGFHLHPKLKTLLERRRDALKGAPIDWGFRGDSGVRQSRYGRHAGSLERRRCAPRTFTQRHLEFYDYETGDGYMALKNLKPNQAKFEAIDSLLSEYAVMGFEFGYSVADPLTLFCGKRSLAILLTARRSSLISSCSARIGSGISRADLYCCCRMALKDKDRSIPAHALNGFCNSAPKTTCRFATARRPRNISICSGGRCMAAKIAVGSVNRLVISLRKSYCVIRRRHRGWKI